jgi:hypothetical protein
MDVGVGQGLRPGRGAERGGFIARKNRSGRRKPSTLRAATGSKTRSQTVSDQGLAGCTRENSSRARSHPKASFTTSHAKTWPAQCFITVAMCSCSSGVADWSEMSLRQPVGIVVIPNQAVSANYHAVGQCELYDLVAFTKVEGAGRVPHGPPLHHVLGTGPC